MKNSMVTIFEYVDILLKFFKKLLNNTIYLP
ncbi:hypothetical protein SAMN05421857_0247 [Chryseobacterium formosense]|nr:hypothetical protein SAMN05421857_0247 [Chryseobacterium formosense]